MIKKFGFGIALIAALLAITFLLLRVEDTNADKMIEKYGVDAQWVDDGAGGRIYYRNQGNKDAPALLLIHGSNANMHTWNGLIQALQGRYRLISYDQHGHGITGPHANNNYSASAKIDAATRVLNAVGVEKAVWIGNSMGGWLTWRAALEQPDRVSAIVLIGASGAQTEQPVTPYLAAKIAASPIGQMLAPHITPRALVAKSLQQNYADPSKITEQQIDLYWELTRFPGNRTAIKYRASTSREPEKWQNVGEIKIPTLLLWGAKDTVVPESHGHAFKEKIANSQLKIYPDAGHLPMEEIPTQVANDIDTWLQQIRL